MCLRYTISGHILISPDDDLDRLVDALLGIHYDEEFCLALDFDPLFVASLMTAGFLVMSMKIPEGDLEEGDDGIRFLMLPKLHLLRSVLFFPDIHIKKSLKPVLPRYELRVNTDFDFIVNRCISIHGDDWLTEPLIQSIKRIRQGPSPARPVSFGVYRDGVLRAGEFGILVGKVYTSYSGYYDENSAGTAQLVLTAQYLRDNGFAFLDFGMPLEYKTELGATDLDPQRFVDLFRQGREG